VRFFSIQSIDAKNILYRIMPELYKSFLQRRLLSITAHHQISISGNQETKLRDVDPFGGFWSHFPWISIIFFFSQTNSEYL
jgi:hypothetical protein